MNSRLRKPSLTSTAITVNDEMMREAQHSAFHDKEDALQYYSALYAGADMIITFNVHDFQPYSSLQVMHPAEFLLLN